MDVTEDKPHAPEEVEHEAEDAHEVSSSHEAPSSRTSDGSGSPSQKKGGLFRIENGFKSAFTATGKFFKTTKDKVSESKFGEKMKEAGKKGKVRSFLFFFRLFEFGCFVSTVETTITCRCLCSLHFNALSRRGSHRRCGLSTCLIYRLARLKFLPILTMCRLLVIKSSHLPGTVK